MTINTTEIESFLAILQYKNLTEASKALFISQSTLSQRLFELERKTGMTLLERGRGGKNLVLTQSGKQFLLIAQRWESLIQETKQLQTQANELSLTIGAVDSFHLCIFPPLYKTLRQHTPKINLNLKTYNSAELYLQVDRGEIDIGFTLFDLPVRNIVVEKIYSEQRVVLVKDKPAKNLSASEFIKLEDLDPGLEIFFVGDAAYHTWYQRWKEEKGYPALQADTVQLLFLLLDKPGSWSVVPMCIASHMASNGSYSYYKLENSPAGRSCYKIHAKHLAANTAQSIKILESYLVPILEQNK